MTLGMLGSLIGGLGLFMLGMKLMTDGLKFAAGSSLSTILEKWTSTALKGILSGALITALVQSSGAVTVAMIGFVNAGLMKLGQALIVIYGSNIGTTMTGWLVVIVGFKIDIKAFALPLVGVGMLLYLLFGGQRRGAIGEALAGFGLFFLGIDVLKVTFEGLGAGVNLQAYADMGVLGLVVFVAIGAVITVLMQSSSASMAITLTSVAGGLIPIEGAAAMVIGANIGSTSTAMFAAIGATPSAKRVAAAHIVFNVATGLVALILLPFLLYGLARAGHLLGIDEGPVTMLALFHTVFNILGVGLMLPFTGKLVRALEKRFRTELEDAVRPRHLDHTLVSTPALALDALGMELVRVSDITRDMARHAVGSDALEQRRIETDNEVVNRLIDAISDYSNRLQQTQLPPLIGGRLQDAFEVARYLSDLAELSRGVAAHRAALPGLDRADLQASLVTYRAQAGEMLTAADVESGNYSPEAAEAARIGLDEKQDAVKLQILRAGTEGQLTVRQMVDYLDLIRSVRRIGEQAQKAALHLTQLRSTDPELVAQTVDAA